MISRWLFACASSQKIVPVNDYMVSLTTPTTQSKEKVTSNRKATPDDIMINEEDMMRSFHPQYDIQVFKIHYYLVILSFIYYRMLVLGLFNMKVPILYVILYII